MFLLLGVDFIDVFIVVWVYKFGCFGVCNFGVIFVIDYIDFNGDVA